MAKKKVEEETFGDVETPEVPEVPEAEPLVEAPIGEAMVPQLGRHILIDGSGSGTYDVVDAPAGYKGDAPDARLNIGGQNFEHVADKVYLDSDGKPYSIWCYRRM